MVDAQPEQNASSSESLKTAATWKRPAVFASFGLSSLLFVYLALVYPVFTFLDLLPLRQTQEADWLQWPWLVSAVVGLLWYGFLWPRLHGGIYRRLRSRAVLYAPVLLVGPMYGLLWLQFTGILKHERSFEVPPLPFGAILLPVLLVYLVQSMGRDLRRLRGLGESPPWRPCMRASFLAVAVVLVLLPSLYLAYSVRTVFFQRHLFELESTEALKDLVDNEYRRIIHHKCLRSQLGVHDASLGLYQVGDETSVPYLINALSWAPPPGGRACTWGHCVDALERITNHSPGDTYEQWKAWYDDNRTRSRLEWVLEGYRLQNLPVNMPADEATVRAMFGVLGRKESHQLIFFNIYKPRNPLLILDHCDSALVRKVLSETVQSGTTAEKRGCAWYLKYTTTPERSSLLQDLQQDEETSDD